MLRIHIKSNHVVFYSLFNYHRIRHFYSSKWDRRLKTLLEPKRYSQPPTVQEYETFKIKLRNIDMKILKNGNSKINMKIDGDLMTAKKDNLIQSGDGEIKSSDVSKFFENYVNTSDPINSDEFCNDDDMNSLRRLRPIWSSRRCGVLAYKVGCMSLYDEWGVRHAVTVCKVDRCIVLEQKTISKHGYEALKLGIGCTNIVKQSKNNLGTFIKLGIEPKHVIKEIKCSSDAFLPIKHQFSVRHFTPGQWLFVSGFSKAKGFQGCMKRWNFAGGRASHGTEGKAHSSHGAVSQGHSVNVIHRNKKMAGHVGGDDPRCCNCKLIRIETQRNLLFLKGTVPGYKGSVVKISDARGVTAHKNKDLYMHFPTFIPDIRDTLGDNPRAAVNCNFNPKVSGVSISYPVTIQQPPSLTDPFLYPDIPLYDKDQ